MSAKHWALVALTACASAGTGAHAVKPEQLDSHWLRAAPTPVVVQTPARPTPSAADSASYARREHQAQNQQVEKYRGGDVLVIGASGGAILVLLLLLLILI